jgi:hypothetical protein
MSESGQLDVASGKIRFYNSYSALQVGRYQISVEQRLGLKDPGILSADPVFTQKQIFNVAGRRFSLGPEDVHAVYPPAHQEGFFDQTVPHVVLRKRALPWERSVGTDANQNPLPWLALLLFHGAEAPAVQTLALSDVVGRSSTPDANGLLRPKIPSLSSDDPNERAMVIDVPAATFQAIAPTIADLPFLAHIRQVNTGDKELLGLDADGFFSVILGNRLPIAGAVNTAHLVSLEGWTDFLKVTASTAPRTALPAAAQSVRMVTVANWNFTAKPGRGNFHALVSQLSAGSLKVPRQVSTAGAAGESRDLINLANAALDRGYVPLAYDLRNGERSAAWFRGPLVPKPAPRVKRDPFPSAEAALIYDPRTGMFDVSYAVAWQVGRLLGLSDAQFAASLARWRQAGQQVVNKMLARDEYKRRLTTGRLLGELEAIEELNSDDPVQFAKKKQLLIQFIAELQDQQAFSRALAQFVAAPEVSPVMQLKGVPPPRQRLAGGLRTLTEADIADIESKAPGAARAQRIAELLALPATAPNAGGV